MLSDYSLGISSHKSVTKMYICSTGENIFSRNIIIFWLHEKKKEIREKQRKS